MVSKDNCWLRIMADKLNYSFLSFLFLVFFPLFVLFSECEVIFYPVIIPLICILIVINFMAYKNVQVMTIIILYLSIYFFYMLPYFYKNIRLSQYTLYNNQLNFQKVLLMFYIFYTGLLFPLKSIINPEKCKLVDKINILSDIYIRFLLFCGVVFLLFIALRQGQNIFKVNNYYEAYRNNLQVMGGATLFSIIPIFILGCCYSKNKRKRFLVVFIFSAVFCLYAVSRGTRMVIVPYVMLIFILCFDRVFSNKIIIIITFTGFLVLLSLNLIKAGIKITPTNLFSEGNSEFIISHHADMDYIACSVFGLLEEERIPWGVRISSNIGTLLESFIPPKMLPETWKYPHVIASLLPNGGGCLFFVILYLSFFGYTGIFLFGCLLGFFINKCYEKNTSLDIIIFIVMIFIFAIRWMSYDFHVILRLPVYTLIVVIVLGSTYTGGKLNEYRN